MANALVELVSNPELRQRMALRGRAHAQGFRWSRVAGQVMDYYNRLLEERDPLRSVKGLE